MWSHYSGSAAAYRDDVSRKLNLYDFVFRDSVIDGYFFSLSANMVNVEMEFYKFCIWIKYGTKFMKIQLFIIRNTKYGDIVFIRRYSNKVQEHLKLLFHKLTWFMKNSVFVEVTENIFDLLCAYLFIFLCTSIYINLSVF